MRLLALFLVDSPGYLDAADSFLIGRSIAHGSSFVSPVVWHWLSPPSGVPQPSNDYWPPLEALLVGVSMRLFGDGFRAAQIPNAICAAALPIVAYLQATRWNADRQSAWLAAFFALAAGPYFARFATTDAAVPFALAGSLVLLAGNRSPAFGGGLIGLAHLARADGLLLFAAIRPRGWLWAAFGFLAVAGWWLIRNTIVIGAPFGVGTNAIWLTEYNDLFRPGGIGTTAWAARGIVPFLADRVAAASANLQSLGELGLYALWPFALVGGWRIRPVGASRYLTVLAVFMTVIAPFPGQRGGLSHSLAALLPAFSALAALGLTARLQAAHRDRLGYQWIAAAGYAVASMGIAFQLAASWRDWDREMIEVARFIGPDTVAIADPASYTVHSGGYAVSLPNLPINEVGRFLDRYGVRYLVVGSAFPAAWLGRLDDPPANWRSAGTIGQFRVYRID